MLTYHCYTKVWMVKTLVMMGTGCPIFHQEKDNSFLWSAMLNCIIGASSLHPTPPRTNSSGQVS
jgi:hypothetical protein